MSQHGRARPTLKGKKHSVSTAPSFEIAMTQGFSEPELFLHLLRAAVPFLPVLLLLPPSGRFRGPLASACFPRGGRRGSEQRATKRCPQKEAKKKKEHPDPTNPSRCGEMRAGRKRPRATRPQPRARRRCACAAGDPGRHFAASVGRRGLPGSCAEGPRSRAAPEGSRRGGRCRPMS